MLLEDIINIFPTLLDFIIAYINLGAIDVLVAIFESGEIEQRVEGGALQVDVENC